MALNTSMYFQTPIISGPTTTERRATQQQLRLRDFQLADAERRQQAAQNQAEDEQKLDAILRGGGMLSAAYLSGAGGGSEPLAPMAGVMGQDGPQSAPATSLRAMAGLSVPGNAGGQYRVGGGSSARTGQVDRLGGRTRQQIYDQIAQQVGPAQADAWLQREMAFDKGFAETSKEQAGAEEAWAKVDNQTLQNAAAETQRAADLMAYVTSQADLDRVRAQLAAEGNDDVDSIPEVYQPGMEQQWVQRAMGVVKSAELELQKRRDAETKRHNQTTEDLTRRGQDLTDARERVKLENAGSRLPAPPAGYRYTAEGSLEAIPGGPAAQREQQAAEKRQLALQGREAKAQNIIATIDEAIPLVDGWFAAGAGSGLSSMIGGTSGANLEALLGTIKANLGFEELQAMREASPTGGALGQVAVQELMALQATVAALDRSQSDEQLKRNLVKARQHYQNWLNAVRQARLGDGGEAPDLLHDRGGSGGGATGGRMRYNPQTDSLEPVQ